MTAALLVAAAVAGAAALLVLARRRLLVVTVRGPSMTPAYRHGDRIVVLRTGPGALRRGSVVVLERPTPTGPASRWIIKRVAALPGDPVPEELVPTMPDGTVVPPRMLVILGDNPDSSHDSRQIGFVPAERVLGVAVHILRARSTDTTTLGIPERYEPPA
jgi:signal peptidase I